jgi:signal transduction histidine kinase
MQRPSELEQEATESQHRRLALGMRDNLALNLVALKLDITMLHARTGATQPLLHRRAAQALSTLNSCICNVREIINELHPVTLELGLSAAIEWQLQQMQRRQSGRSSHAPTPERTGRHSARGLACITHQRAGLRLGSQAGLVSV